MHHERSSHTAHGRSLLILSPLPNLEILKHLHARTFPLLSHSFSVRNMCHQVCRPPGTNSRIARIERPQSRRKWASPHLPSSSPRSSTSSTSSDCLLNRFFIRLLRVLPPLSLLEVEDELSDPLVRLPNLDTEVGALLFSDWYPPSSLPLPLLSLLSPAVREKDPLPVSEEDRSSLLSLLELSLVPLLALELPLSTLPTLEW